MAKDQGMVMQGEVMANLWPGGYTVRIHELWLDVNAVAAGKMRNHRIGILPGDSVDVELSPYEPTKWRIIYRHSKDKPRPAAQTDAGVQGKTIPLAPDPWLRKAA